MTVSKCLRRASPGEGGIFTPEEGAGVAGDAGGSAGGRSLRRRRRPTAAAGPGVSPPCSAGALRHRPRQECSLEGALEMVSVCNNSGLRVPPEAENSVLGSSRHPEGRGAGQAQRRHCESQLCQGIAWSPRGSPAREHVGRGPALAVQAASGDI